MGEITGHILHRDFYDTMHDFLSSMAQSRIKYLNIQHSVSTLLHQGIYKQQVVANNRISQDALLEAHNDLITITDINLCYLAHISKINKFMPYVVKEFGDSFYYDDPTSMSRPIGFQLDLFCDYDTTQNAMSQIILDAYTNIDSLRFMMTPETLEKAAKQDYFSATILEGKLSEISDLKLRIEATYLGQHGQVLGLYPEAISYEMRTKFEECANPDQFITAITPESVIFTHHDKPAAGKPRLVY